MKARKIAGLDPAATLAENAAKIVCVRTDELRSFVPAALDPAAARSQHDMRIAAKRLRYVLEATGFCFGGQAETARLCAKELQELLGEIHDIDVMLPRLGEHRRELRDADAEAVSALAAADTDIQPALAGRAPHRTAYRGLEVLEVYMLARRRKLFGRFEQTWARQERDRVWDGLADAALALLDAPAPTAPFERPSAGAGL